MWSDRERAARGERNVIPGAGGRSSLRVGDAEAKYNVKRIMDSHDPDGGELCESRTHVNGPPFEAPVILTSAPRSSFFSVTLIQTRYATPRSIPLHRPVLVIPHVQSPRND